MTESKSVKDTKKSDKKVVKKDDKPKTKKQDVNLFNNNILIAPLGTEKSILLVDTQNTIVFYVSRNARKEDIKNEIEGMFDVKVDDIRTSITMKGYKKAYVKLDKEYHASDLATKLGMM